MQISNFDDLLLAATQQAIPQRLLFLFTTVELPAGASEAEHANYVNGNGGALVPLMSVDKTPESIRSFDQISNEANLYASEWKFVFVAALQNPFGQPIDVEMVDDALNRMTQDLKMGQIEGFIPFDRSGNAVQFQ